jgi:CBS domain-containing protein
MKVADVCSYEIDILPPDATAQQAAVAMGDLSARTLLIGTADTLAGIVTDRDLVIRLVARGLDPATTPVEAVMSTDVYSCRADADLDEVQAEMRSRQVRRAPVVDEAGRTIGLLEIIATAPAGNGPA